MRVYVYRVIIMKMNDLNKHSGIMERGKFSFESAKLYITALILLFHVLPLAFIGSGEIGKALFNTYGMMMLNPLFIAIIMIIYGVKVGFNFKMPLLCILAATVSIPMYHDIAVNYEMGILYQHMVATAIALIVYTIDSFISLFIGAFIKHIIP